MKTRCRQAGGEGKVGGQWAGGGTSEGADWAAPGAARATARSWHIGDDDDECKHCEREQKREDESWRGAEVHVDDRSVEAHTPHSTLRYHGAVGCIINELTYNDEVFICDLKDETMIHLASSMFMNPLQSMFVSST